MLTSVVVGLRGLSARRAMGTRCNQALLRPAAVRTEPNRSESQRHTSKDMKDIDDFLKQTKIRFLEINQKNTEGEITKWELGLLYGSIVFLLTMAGFYLYLYKKEFGTEIEYDKYTSEANVAESDSVIEEEKKKTWKDHPLIKEV